MNRGSEKIKNKKVLTFVLMVMAFFCLTLIGGEVLAQTDAITEIQTGVDIIEEPLGLPSTDIRIIITNIIRYALGLIGIIMLVLMMYGGFLWMTAGGNEEQIGKAKKVLRNAIIGLVLILSAYSIVLFVIRMLGIGDGVGGIGGKAGAPGIQRFEGSGSLGYLIKDHYPTRNQTDVPRNTKIIITFSKSVLASSFIEDTNKDGIYGNCSSTFKSWTESCDQILLDKDGKMSDKLINIKDVTNNKSIIGGAILAPTTTVNNVSGVYTIIIKPFVDANDKSGGYLGSASQKITYSVRLGEDIKLNDSANKNPSAFGKSLESFYTWKFITDTKFDKTPPYVKSVYPSGSSAKNTVIQVDFSEAMDPTGIQGSFKDQGSYYELDGQNVYLVSANSKIPQGNFELSNGYRTLEFTSTQECGKNACGKSIFCLPVCDESTATCPTIKKIGSQGENLTVKTDDYKMLLRAGTPINSSTSWEAIPFSGFMDVSSNSLDGDHDGISEDPGNASTLDNFPISISFDNYYWKFTLQDYIDKDAPFIVSTKPGINVGSVSSTEDIVAVFSKRMRVGSIYTIAITENKLGKFPMWFRFDIDLPSTTTEKYTTTTIQHGLFLANTDYYPALTSDIEDVNFNCFYPGKGPDSNNGAVSKICDGAINCNTATSSPGTDLYCNSTIGLKSTAENKDNYTIKKCIEDLKKELPK